MDQASERLLLLVAVVVGMLTMAALPLSGVPLQEMGDDAARLWVSSLAFGTPATLLAVGRLRSRAWMMSLGLTLAVVLLPIVLLEAFGGIAALSILVGPVVAAVVVGMVLRDTDLVAAAGFLGGGTIAVIGGFAAAGAGPAASAAVIVIAATIGVAVASARVLRLPGGE